MISVNLLTKGLDFLNGALSSILQKQSKTCDVCKIYNIEYTYELGIYLIIDLYFAITKQKKATQDPDLFVVLNDIPNIFSVHDKLYYLLRSLINFIPPISKNLKPVEHYVAICLRKTTMSREKYDDGCSSLRIVRPLKIIK
jgi:hypothetical protein